MTDKITSNVDVTINTTNLSVKVVISNGAFYTTEDGTPLTNESNTYLTIPDGIKVKITGIDVEVKP
jgi:hypothetical protein